jgi:hypothetical protein
MGFDPSSVAHIMSVLTDLYSDPVGAIVREYATNAWDSHVEAGVTRPINVTTPNPLSQFYRVKDYGVGLSVDEIERIYAMYGASTKRDTDEQTGMLGLGSKSALTHTNQFTLVAVKDGVMATVSVSREPDGTGAMQIVDTRATNDSNGVEITIPAAAGTFKEKAERFFSFWPKDRYILDGNTVHSATDGMDEICPGIFIEIGNSSFRLNNCSYVVMGGVAYPIDQSRLNNDGMWRMIAYVDIGDVHFTPSREALQYTPKTIATVESLRDKVVKNIESQIEKKISECGSHGEALRMLQKYKPVLRGNTIIKYRTLPIPHAVNLSGIPVMRISNYGRNRYDVGDWESYSGGKNWIALRVSNTDMTSNNRRTKLRRWIEQQRLGADKIILLGDKTLAEISPFLDEVPSYGWEDVKLDQSRIYNYGSMGPQGFIVTYVDPISKSVMSKKSMDLQEWAGKTFVHYSPTEKNTSGYIRNVVSILDVVAIELAAGRFDKLARNTGSQHIKTYVKVRVDQARPLLTESDRIKMTLDRSSNSWYTWYEKSRMVGIAVDDPEIQKWIKSLKEPLSPAGKIQQTLGGGIDVMQDDPVKKYLLVYKLISGYLVWTVELMEESIFYMNAAFAAGRN